jgi:restriction endonuclease Mrr
MFERLGYEVKQTPRSNDHGRDAILMKDGKKFLLECKRYAEDGSSGRPDLQKFHSQIIHERAISGFFVTTGRFTREAREFRPNPPIKLIDANQLVRMMFDSKPATGDDDSYDSMCRNCCAIVRHRLRTPEPLTCPKWPCRRAHFEH